MTQGGKHYNYYYDGKGNITACINSDASLSQTEGEYAYYKYDPFGGIISQTGTLDQPYQFSTKRYVAGFGKVAYEFRWYDPVLGKWMWRDPLGEKGGMNLYRFASGNPINQIDTDGLLNVNYWAPHGSSVGHVSITLDNGTYISWWPDPNQVASPLGYVLGTPGIARSYDFDKHNENNLDPEMIHLTGLDEGKIQTWWNDFNTPNQQYSLHQNCATVAKNALNAGLTDALMPSYYSSGDNTISTWTPMDVRSYATRLQWLSQMNSQGYPYDEVGDLWMELTGPILPTLSNQMYLIDEIPYVIKHLMEGGN